MGDALDRLRPVSMPRIGFLSLSFRIGFMDTKERLRELVDGLDAEQAADALHLLGGRYVPRRRTCRALPSWVGAFSSDADSGEGARRHKDILREEIGFGNMARS